MHITPKKIYNESEPKQSTERHQNEGECRVGDYTISVNAPSV